jgi:hypothetical protein
MRKIILSTGFLIATLLTYAQNPIIIKKNINWEKSPFLYSPTETYTLSIYRFDGAMYHPDHPTLPVFSQQVSLDGPGTLDVRVLDVRYASLDKAPSGVGFSRAV